MRYLQIGHSLSSEPPSGYRVPCQMAPTMRPRAMCPYSPKRAQQCAQFALKVPYSLGPSVKFMLRQKSSAKRIICLPDGPGNVNFSFWPPHSFLY
jgi:hypothetical protein